MFAEFLRLLRIERTNLPVCLVLVLATFAVYAQTRTFDFINYDDGELVQHNPHLRGGITSDGLRYALVSADGGNWIPLTRVSELVDFQLFGDQAGWHHLDNVALHALASLLLFAFLNFATGARGPAAFVAFVFALHPLHVESVAWISERKDVLCAVFWFASLRVWAGYVRRPAPARYIGALLLFAMGLMAKPMIVTLPFLLLLLDVWPFQRALTVGLLLEKLPFLAVSLGSAAVAFLAQRAGGAVQSLAAIPVGLRFENALVSTIIYAADTFWPSRLALLYPYPARIHVPQAAGAALALAAVSILVVRARRTRGWLTTGWFWFLWTLLPVIGLVQVGAQSRADRYMYVPMVGLSIMAAWGAADLARRRPRTRPWIAGLASAACVCFAAAAWRQTQYWKNPETLFTRTIQVTTDNREAWVHLALAVAGTPQRSTDARKAFETALRVKPDAPAHTNLGVLLMLVGRDSWREAADHFKIALRLDPHYAPAHYNLGLVLAGTGRLPEAIDEGRAAVRFNPDDPDMRYDLASWLFGAHRTDEAVSECEEALRLRPDFARAHNLLGAVLTTIPGRTGEAIAQLNEALRLDPDYGDAHTNLAAALTNVPGALFETLFHLEEAVRLEPGSPSAHINLAKALLQVPGRVPEAIAQLKAATHISPNPALQQKVEELEAAERQAEK